METTSIFNNKMNYILYSYLKWSGLSNKSSDHSNSTYFPGNFSCKFNFEFEIYGVSKIWADHLSYNIHGSEPQWLITLTGNSLWVADFFFFDFENGNNS